MPAGTARPLQDHGAQTLAPRAADSGPAGPGRRDRPRGSLPRELAGTAPISCFYTSSALFFGSGGRREPAGDARLMAPENPVVRHAPPR
jgi:hypothetical protein